MVSTRGVKVKFSEGERVLCYEPDPTKARVLYDSKVLQIFVEKDAGGKKQIDYLIHFQGWNSSWDRKVPEHFVLKCTEESRQLQKQLAEEAHIKLSIKSNRVLSGPGFTKEKRKRRLSETIREAMEKEKKNQTESESSSQPSGFGEEELSSTSWGVASGNSVEEVPLSPQEPSEEWNEDTYNKFFPLTIPQFLKEFLDRDSQKIGSQQLVALPADKCVLNILEDYVHFFAVRYVGKNKEKNKNEKQKDRQYLTLDLCKEVVDGIRITFESYIYTLLLYPNERQQIEKIKNVPRSIKVDDTFKTRKSNAKELEEVKTTIKPPEKKENTSTRRILRSKRHMSDDSSNLVPQEYVAPNNSDSGRSSPSTNVSCGTSGLYSITNGSHNNMLDVRGIAHLLQNWTLVPEEHRSPTAPSLLFGAVHLLRLFVKLPEIFCRMNLTVDRKKILLPHMEIFLEYLNTHEDLFNEVQYTPAL